ncbi:hypothetical protein ENBRE01_2169 [Enteropsectra breve]|nr:hypothetical protein ENBRE01_2169 [Enteropsectra breve]
MQNYNDIYNNGKPVFDMATMTKAIGEYSGKPNEDIRNWIKKVKTVAKLGELREEMVVKIAVLSLRGVASDWIAGRLTEVEEISWEELETGLLARFECQKIADDTLTRFLKRKECADYNTFIEMLEEARIIKTKQGIDMEHLMR